MASLICASIKHATLIPSLITNKKSLIQQSNSKCVPFHGTQSLEARPEFYDPKVREDSLYNLHSLRALAKTKPPTNVPNF